MQYPLISEYLASVREANDNLDTLSHLVPVLDKYGEPYRSSGAFAVVFKMKNEQTGKCYALKCFTEEQEGRAEAYRQIAEELEFVDSPYITSVKYLEKELFVDSNCENEEFPVLLMDWIEGETMETYVAAHYTDSHAMSMLCYRFCKMAAWLRSQSFAHGDIKPDNIMVRPDGTLTLVDYDGMFVPAMKGQKSPTVGTKDFSHPLRTTSDFDETIDDFALASIALSLKAISLHPSLLQTYGASDRLLFSAADYLDLSKSNTFAALQSLLADEEAETLMSMFLLASAKKDLSMCSFRLFGVQKPKEEDVWSTVVTKEDFENAVVDEFGVRYSKDWKRLLKAPYEIKGEYHIREGVKVIGDRAFFLCKSLTSINIPNSVTNIGNDAFYICESLTKIIIPSSVVNMNGNPFRGWNGNLHNESKAFIYEHQVLFSKDKTTLIAYRSKDTNYIIPNGVTNIGDHAFYWCLSLTKINIPNSVTNIGDEAFEYCLSLTNINIPNSVTNIGDRFFSNCHSLTDINIPDSVTNIGDEAFSCCKSLFSIKIPNSVTNIGDKTFYGCESLTSIEIPNNVTNIGDEAFSGCESLTSINIPSRVKNIGDGTFSGCESLTNINIPNSVTNIGNSAFSCCKLTSINIPSSVVNINGNPFCGWNGDLHNESKAFVYEHQVLFNKDKTTLIAYRSKDTNYIIPDSVTNIGNRAFWCCRSLTSINIPDTVTNIGDYAFLGCESLKSINIPDGVTNIGDGAFEYCVSLTSINIPNSVTNIGDSAFSGCGSLTSINIPDGVTNIGNEAFSMCHSLTNINISNSVTNIGDKAFWYCYKLTSINIPNSVTKIGNEAFMRCESLTSINIPDGVTNIGNKAFSRCHSLTNINIPNSVTNIGDEAFWDCYKLTSINIPNSVTRIGNNALVVVFRAL